MQPGGSTQASSNASHREDARGAAATASYSRCAQTAVAVLAAAGAAPSAALLLLLLLLLPLPLLLLVVGAAPSAALLLVLLLVLLLLDGAAPSAAAAAPSDELLACSQHPHAKATSSTARAFASLPGILQFHTAEAGGLEAGARAAHGRARVGPACQALPAHRSAILEQGAVVHKLDPLGAIHLRAPARQHESLWSWPGSCTACGRRVVAARGGSGCCRHWHQSLGAPPSPTRHLHGSSG